jgi:hypothetical protein
VICLDRAFILSTVHPLNYSNDFKPLRFSPSEFQYIFYKFLDACADLNIRPMLLCAISETACVPVLLSCKKPSKINAGVLKILPSSYPNQWISNFTE